MATILNTMYPPQVETFMPSFCYNSPAKIWFNISSYDDDDISSIQFIHVSMVDQRNNTNVFAGKDSSNNTVYPQYYPVAFNNDNNNSGYDPDKKKYWVKVPPQLLKTEPYYNTNQYYKIQLRFDLTGSAGFNPGSSDYTDPTNYFKIVNNEVTANALKLASYTNYNENNFTEWSVGTLIKPILIPTLSISKFNTSETTPTQINPSTDTPIVGRVNFNNIDGDENIREENERLLWYQIKILSDDKKDIFSDSGKVYAENNSINYYVDTSMLSFDETYYLRINYETTNGYTNKIDYPIKTIQYSTDSVEINCLKFIDEDLGIIKLEITKPKINDLSVTTGYLVIRRSSHRSNFKHWDLIAAKEISNLGDSLIIEDNTIESMTGYRYQIQYTDGDKIYKPIYKEDNDIIHCDFYGGLFSDKNRMLEISFNFQPSNRANAANRAKTDTLGGQYPIFTQNSKLKYHTYNISGRISTEDNGEIFLPKEEVLGEEYFNYRYNIDEFTDTSAFGGNSGSSVPIERIQPYNDWLYEREYRDIVEEWLNNGKPKLFRSMAEGNMIVMLDNVTMSPDVTLGRRLYDFSATMYEIGDGKNIQSIASLGLYDIVDER